MNVFGERQHPEKFIPMCIKKIRDGESVTIHSDKTKKFQDLDIIFMLKMLLKQFILYLQKN